MRTAPRALKLLNKWPHFALWFPLGLDHWAYQGVPAFVSRVNNIAKAPGAGSGWPWPIFRVPPTVPSGSSLLHNWCFSWLSLIYVLIFTCYFINNAVPRELYRLLSPCISISLPPPPGCDRRFGCFRSRKLVIWSWNT